MDGKRTISRLTSVRRKAVSNNSQELVSLSYLNDDLDKLPLVITPKHEGINLANWVSSNSDYVNKLLLENAGLLFRGFNVKESVQLEEVMDGISEETLDYKFRTTKRTNISGNVYTSTDQPPSLHLRLHNETSYTNIWPRKIAFLSVTVAPVGGETPICDSRKILASLPPKLVSEFVEKKIMYVKNTGNSIEIPWQEIYQTSDKNEVEKICRSRQISYEWKANGELRTKQVRPVIAQHPLTKEVLWFNQIHLFHKTCYQPGVIERLFADTADMDLPYNVLFGDGSVIPGSMVDDINEVYEREKIAFQWEEGDVMILDNMLAAHGRHPFEGDRKVLVVMSDSFNGDSHE